MQKKKKGVGWDEKKKNGDGEDEVCGALYFYFSMGWA